MPDTKMPRLEGGIYRVLKPFEVFTEVPETPGEYTGEGEAIELEPGNFVLVTEIQRYYMIGNQDTHYCTLQIIIGEQPASMDLLVEDFNTVTETTLERVVS